MMTYKQWLQEHGKDSCKGCRYADSHRVKCLYRGPYCARYDEYVRRQMGDQKTLF